MVNLVLLAAKKYIAFVMLQMRELLSALQTTGKLLADPLSQSPAKKQDGKRHLKNWKSGARLSCLSAADGVLSPRCCTHQLTAEPILSSAVLTFGWYPTVMRRWFSVPSKRPEPPALKLSRGYDWPAPRMAHQSGTAQMQWMLPPQGLLKICHLAFRTHSSRIMAFAGKFLLPLLEVFAVLSAARRSPQLHASSEAAITAYSCRRHNSSIIFGAATTQPMRSPASP